jgi:GNAT superfamily N-acetyltransferase
MNAEVRQAVLSDRDAIARFIVDAYEELAPYKGETRWDWQFRGNPFANNAEDRLPIWIAIDEGMVVGQVAVQPASLNVEGKEHEAGWIVDVMVLPSHRSRSIGSRLYQATADGHPLLMILTMAPATRRLAEKVGCITLAPVIQFTRWMRLDADAVLRYLIVRTTYHPRVQTAARIACRGFGFHHLFAWLANPMLRVRDVLRKPKPRSRTVEIVEIARFGAEVDQLWESARGDYPVSFPRNSRFLNWRFVECPDMNYRRFIARRNGQTVGYVVLRRAEKVELPQGFIVDVFARKDDLETVRDLLVHSLETFGNEVAAVDCAVSHSGIQSLLRELGFFKTRTVLPVCTCRDAQMRERLLQLKDQWLFTKADHDWDQIHIA